MLKKNFCAAALMLPLLGGLFCGPKRMVGFALIRRGVEIDPTSFTKVKLDELIAAGNFIGMIAPYQMENNNQDADFATSTQKERSKRIQGVKGWRFIFDQTNCFQNQLNKLDNSIEWGVAPILEDGTIVLGTKASGKATAFDCRLFVTTYDLPLTADVTGAVLEVDLTPSAMSYWQGSADTYTSTEFKFNEINPVAGLNISVGILAAAATSTPLVVSALCSDAFVSGLTDPTNWAVEVNGVRTAPSAVAYNASTGTYTLTHSALVAGQSIVFITSKNGSDIYVKDGSYYTGRTAAKVVTA